jgi:hypothetical protein
MEPLAYTAVEDIPKVRALCINGNEVLNSQLITLDTR